MKAQIKYEIFERLKKNNPNPTTELIYNSDYELLVSVVLSAQATDVSVNKATKNLFKVANTPQNILKLGQAEVETYIKTIGLYKTKAKNLIMGAQTILEKFDGIIPQNRECLMSIAGVGRKTANVILNTLYGMPYIAVDTHIFRVSNRIGFTQATNVLQTELQLSRRIPKEFKQNAHHWLILHGRYICQARKPKCSDCLIEDLCQKKLNQ